MRTRTESTEIVATEIGGQASHRVRMLPVVGAFLLALVLATAAVRRRSYLPS